MRFIEKGFLGLSLAVLCRIIPVSTAEILTNNCDQIGCVQLTELAVVVAGTELRSAVQDHPV